MTRGNHEMGGPTPESMLAWVVGQPLTYLGHLAATGDLGFGERVTILDEAGRTRTVSRVAVHVQCPWRVTAGERVLIGSADIFAPAAESTAEAAPTIAEEFDWEKHRTRFDERASALLEGPALVVRSAALGSAGRLLISFSAGEVFEAFPDGSLDREAWRIFRMDRALPHFVVSAKGPAPGWNR